MAEEGLGVDILLRVLAVQHSRGVDPLPSWVNMIGTRHVQHPCLHQNLADHDLLYSGVAVEAQVPDTRSITYLALLHTLPSIT